MNYTQQQIEKPLIEQEWLNPTSTPADKGFAQMELDEVFRTQERDFVAAAKSVYQGEA